MNIDKLLVHPSTLNKLKNFLNSPKNGLILTAPDGSGKHTLALNLIADLLGLEDAQKLNNYPFFKLINPSADNISIDEVRQIQQFVKLKIPKQGSEIKRVILVVDADRMRHEAQNALLKSLEEPPLDTSYVLTVASADGLLSTILSRLTVVEVLNVSIEQAEEYFKTVSNLENLHALSSGQPGLLNALVDNQSHPRIDSVNQAKQILKLKPSERLLEVDRLNLDRNQAAELVNAIKRIFKAGLKQSAKNSNNLLVESRSNAILEILEAEDSLSKNANIKLVIDKLLWSL